MRSLTWEPRSINVLDFHIRGNDELLEVAKTDVKVRPFLGRDEMLACAEYPLQLMRCSKAMALATGDAGTVDFAAVRADSAIKTGSLIVDY